MKLGDQLAVALEGAFDKDRNAIYTGKKVLIAVGIIPYHKWNLSPGFGHMQQLITENKAAKSNADLVSLQRKIELEAKKVDAIRAREK